MRSLPWVPHETRASERILDAVYRAAYAGLKDDSLATVAGLDPVNYRQLYELDPQVKEHFLRGRADSELEHALKLAQASREGDAKSSLAILQHVHGWTAKQQIEVSGSVNATLETALDGVAMELLAKIRQPQPRVLEHDGAPRAPLEVIQERVRVLTQPKQEQNHALDTKAIPAEAQQETVLAAGEESRGSGDDGDHEVRRPRGRGDSNGKQVRHAAIEDDNAGLFQAG